MGYDSYVDRAIMGGMMPESWGRILERAQEHHRAEIDAAEVTDCDRQRALADLGLYSERDTEWSTRVSGWCDWQISRIPAEPNQ
jgi:hypothetical protein